MNIIGPDYLVFGVDDIAACTEFLTAFGLEPVNLTENGGLFAALDGTGIIVRHKNDPDLPAALPNGAMLRQQVYGVRTDADIVAIADELAKDRKVHRLADGTIETTDDLGFALKFQITVRKQLDMPAEKINAPGAPAQRAPNELGVWDDMPAKPRTLSHNVLFVPDMEAATGFYCNRLGFVITDELQGAGPFLRPKANDDHHTLFFIRTPEHMKGMEHLAFHMGGPTELMVAGTRLMNKGFESFWGPGRHKFGSNWFWYFKSPLGCNVEYDADMDKHDDSWVARQRPISPEASQMFLLQFREKWIPGPGPKP
ncbi:MAG: glyoxalase [Hoeflea sp.]|uniref:VOC family protein n=1 Tax=Hoeflea sp. TaxID=1940281 RepID=UPI000C0E5DD7|nr:VOC family protein [Hoeflea sp.]PHR25370.1 MAG: glyoxalase [Hoeflea sp.]